MMNAGRIAGDILNNTYTCRLLCEYILDEKRDQDLRNTAVFWLGTYNDKYYINKIISTLPEDKIQKLNMILNDWYKEIEEEDDDT